MQFLFSIYFIVFFWFAIFIDVLNFLVRLVLLREISFFEVLSFFSSNFVYSLILIKELLLLFLLKLFWKKFVLIFEKLRLEINSLEFSSLKLFGTSLFRYDFIWVLFLFMHSLVFIVLYVLII